VSQKPPREKDAGNLRLYLKKVSQLQGLLSAGREKRCAWPYLVGRDAWRQWSSD